MIDFTKHKIFSKNIVAIFTAAMFFSCEGNLKEIQKLAAHKIFPVGIAENLELKYTDSTKLKLVVTGPIYKDFGNQTFPYKEFPKGIHVDFYNDKKEKSNIIANYGIIYTQTGLIELKGNVTLKTHDGKSLNAPQLYWDQKNNWGFTDGSYEFTSPDLKMKGTGIDFNKEFTLVNSHGNSGKAVINDKKDVK